MVGLAVGFYECDAMSLADLPCRFDQEFSDSVGDGIASIFGYQDDVGVQGKDHMPSISIIIRTVGHICYYIPCEYPAASQPVT